jgi:hypothetical protein
MTSIEWLIDKLGISEITHKKLFEQAKEMHKQEIIKAQSYAISNADMTNNKGYFDCEKYYEETYNNKQ